MVYKFDDKSNKKATKRLISIAPLLAIILAFIYVGWTTAIMAFLIAAFDFYYTRNINRRNKVRIKELSIKDRAIILLFFCKSKGSLALKEADYDVDINEKQAIFSDKRKHIILGIANKDEMEEPRKWSDLIANLTV